MGHETHTLDQTNLVEYLQINELALMCFFYMPELKLMNFIIVNLRIGQSLCQINNNIGVVI